MAKTQPEWPDDIFRALRGMEIGQVAYVPEAVVDGLQNVATGPDDDLRALGIRVLAKGGVDQIQREEVVVRRVKQQQP